MDILLLIFGVVIVVVIIFGLVSHNPQDIDEEAAQEAAEESPEQLLAETTKRPQTPEEREAENKRIEFENH